MYFLLIDTCTLQKLLYIFSEIINTKVPCYYFDVRDDSLWTNYSLDYISHNNIFFCWTYGSLSEHRNQTNRKSATHHLRVLEPPCLRDQFEVKAILHIQIWYLNNDQYFYNRLTLPTLTTAICIHYDVKKRK